MVKESDRSEGSDKVKVPEAGKEANVDQKDLQQDASKLVLDKKTVREAGYAKDQAFTVSPDGKGSYKELLAQLKESGEGQTAQQVKLVKLEDQDRAAAKPEEKGDASTDSTAASPDSGKEGSVVVTNDAGQVTSITRAGGKPTLNFEYGPPPPEGDGQLTTIRDADGNAVAWRDGGSWYMQGPDGKPQEYPNTTISVDTTGDIQRTNVNDGSSVTYRMDNSKETYNADGSMIATNSDGQVAYIARAGGEPEYEIKYSPPPPEGDGQPTEINEDGKRLAVRNGDTWSMAGDDGELKEFPNTKITVDDQGNIKREHLDDGTSVTYGIDNSKTYTSPSGREYRETDQGIEYEVKKGDNPWNIVKDSLKAQGNPDPSSAEIVAELKRIEKATGRDMNDTIYAGDKFVIPPREATEPAANDTTKAPTDTPTEDKDKNKPEADAQLPTIVPLDQAQGETETPPNTVVESADGPVMTKDADGNIRTFNYDREGNLNEIVDEDGSLLTQQQEEDGSYKWHRYDRDGNPVMENGKPVTYDEVDVDHYGALSYRKTGSDVTETEYMNNTRVEGSATETTITESDGTVKHYTHDAEGHVTATSTPKGHAEYDPESGSYKFYNTEGEPIEDPYGITDISIDKKGDLTIRYADGTVASKWPDAPTQIAKPYVPAEEPDQPATSEKPTSKDVAPEVPVVLVAPEVPVIAPYDPAHFRPEGDSYNPVQPPGFDTKDLDYADVEEVSDYGGHVTMRATGELEDSGVLDWGDTNFTASETQDASGRVVYRKIEYEGGKDMTFQGPEGPVNIEDVTSITTRYNPDTGMYETGITTASGEVYTAETTTTGEVKTLGLVVPAG